MPDEVEVQRRMKAAIAVERKRCADIVQAARFDEVDRDWRSIVSMIEGGETAEQIKAYSKSED
jgi:hypothetical protein